MSDPTRDVVLVRRLIGVIVLAAVALYATACGGPPKAAATVLRVSATAVTVADAAYTVAYEEAAERLAEDAADLAEYERRMAPFRAVDTALRHAQGAVVVLGATLDSWRAGAADEGDWLAAIACIVPALEAVVAALERHDVDVSGVRSALELARPFAAGICGATSGGER